MYCTHCKYTSFDYLPTCPRCGRDWSEEKKDLNLMWVEPSVYEGKHQRQVVTSPPDQPQPTQAASDSKAPSIPAEKPAQAQPSQSIPTTSAAPLLEANQNPEEEISFPGLDDLVHFQSQPEASDPSKKQVPSDPEESSPEPNLSASPGQQTPGPEEDEPLDLSTLVYDLGLEIEENLEEELERSAKSSPASGPNPAPPDRSLPDQS